MALDKLEELSGWHQLFFRMIEKGNVTTTVTRSPPPLERCRLKVQIDREMNQEH